jgi:hypothetical protein
MSYHTYTFMYQICHEFKSLISFLYFLFDMIWYDIFDNWNWVKTGGRGTVHIYTQTIHTTTQITTNLEECPPCPIFASFTPAFALQLRKKHGKTSVKAVELWQYTYYILPKHPHITKPTHTHTHTYTCKTHTHTRPHINTLTHYKPI